MPHQIIEYSKNLDEAFDIDELVQVMHQSASEVEAYPTAGLRTRAVARANYCIADNHPDNGFINVVMRIAHGRPFDVREAAGKKLFNTLCEFLESVYGSQPLAISYEMQEIDPELRWKKSNLREHIARREQQQTGEQ